MQDNVSVAKTLFSGRLPLGTIRLCVENDAAAAFAFAAPGKKNAGMTHSFN
jgi:hypothetical protein